VVSGLGKGVTASSVGVLLKASGYRVSCIKIGARQVAGSPERGATLTLRDADPYINMDAGTMSPFEHGEVFVLDDGGEARC